MSLQRIAAALGVLMLIAALGAPAQADQTFWTFSTDPTPKAKATPPGATAINYLYYACPQLTMSDGRFNPYDTRGNAGGNATRYRQPGNSCSNSGHHHQKPNPNPGRRYPQGQPLARHT